MTNVDRCLEILREGPATAAEVGLEVGLSSAKVCDCMKALAKRRLIVSRPFVQLLPHEPERPMNLYSLVDYGVRP